MPGLQGMGRFAHYCASKLGESSARALLYGLKLSGTGLIVRILGPAVEGSSEGLELGVALDHALRHCRCAFAAHVLSSMLTKLLYGSWNDWLPCVHGIVKQPFRPAATLAANSGSGHRSVPWNMEGLDNDI